MKMKRKHVINNEQADKLIEKYYDGFTSVEEEKQLQSFLSQANLAEKYHAERAIMGYFEKSKQKPKYKIGKIAGWAVAASALIIFALNIQNTNTTKSVNYAYVDGVKITNMQEIKNLALATLKEVSTNDNTIENCLKNFDNSEIKKQLELFSNLDK